MAANVVMVTLGAEGGLETVDEEQGASYMELKPSATLLVPMELMEGHENLVGCSQLAQPELQDGPTSEPQDSLSLMLDVDEEFKEAEMPLLNDGLVLSMPPAFPAVVQHDGDEPVAKSEVMLLSKEAQDAPVLEAECEVEQREQADVADVEGTSADLVSVKILTTDSNHEPEDIKTTLDEEVAEDKEPAGPLMSEESPQQELPEDVIEPVTVNEERRLDDEKLDAEALHNEPQENGPVEIHTDVASISEEVAAAVEKDDHKTFEMEEDSEDIQTDTETKESVGKQEEAVSDEQAVEETGEEAPACPNKKSIPSTPARRTRGGKSVTFIPPPTEEKEELQEDKKRAVVPALPQRTPRKTKQNKEPAVTPRRSTRRALQQPPEDQPPVDAVEQDAAAFPKSSSPGRRRVSQRTGSARSSQSGNQESSSTELGVGEEEDAAAPKASRSSSSKTPTPSKRRTTQSSTPRRSSRRILGSTDLVSIPLEIVKEEAERDEVFTSPVQYTSKKSKAGAAEGQPVLLEEEEEEREEPASSPGRTTRRSSRNSVTAYSQVRTHKF